MPLVAEIAAFSIQVVCAERNIYGSVAGDLSSNFIIILCEILLHLESMNHLLIYFYKLKHAWQPYIISVSNN